MFDPSMFAGMSSLMAAFFPGAPGGPSLPAGASEEHRTFMAHFHSAFTKLVASSGSSGMLAAAGPPAPALPPFDPTALFGGQATALAAPAAVAEEQQATAAAGEPAAGVDVKQEEAAEGVGGGSPTAAAPAGPQQQEASGNDAQAEANNNSAGEEGEAMQIDSEPVAEAAGATTPQPAAVAQPAAAEQPQPQQQAQEQAGQQDLQPAGAAPADAPCPGTLQASGSGTALAPAAAAVAAATRPAAPAAAPLPSGLTPEQAALQQQALYIGQVMMSLASVFPGMAAAISAMCGMAAAAGFTGPQLPQVSEGKGGRGWGCAKASGHPAAHLPGVHAAWLPVQRALVPGCALLLTDPNCRAPTPQRPPVLCRACSPRLSCRRWAHRRLCRPRLARCWRHGWRAPPPVAAPSATQRRPMVGG